MLNSVRGRCLRHLWINPLFAASWVVFALGTGVGAVVSVAANTDATSAAVDQALRGGTTEPRRTDGVSSAPKLNGAPQSKRPDPSKQRQTWARVASHIRLSLICGYVFWSLYWTVPPCVRLVAKAYKSVATGCATIGVSLISALTLVIPLALAVIIYAPLGGGLIHFMHRWWKLCHASDQLPASQKPRLSPVVIEPEGRDLDDLETALRKLDRLYWNGLISRESYERMRAKMLKKWQ